MSRPTPTHRLAAVGAAAGVATVLLFGAVACGSGSTDAGTNTGTNTGTSADSQSGSGSSTQGRGQDRAGGPPGVNGTVAAVDGTTAQVQSQLTGQVAVTWTSKTTFTRQAGAALKDVTVGSCVLVTPPRPAGGVSGDSNDSSDSSDPSDSGASTSSVTAGTVQISKAVDGSCSGGFGGGARSFSGQGGTPPNGAPGDLPSGAPRDVPSDAPSGGPQGTRRFGFGGAFGKVTAVSGSGFTVESTMPRRPDGDSSDSDGSRDGSGTTTEVSVSVTGDTTYTTDVTGSAGDVKVGSCMRAQGTADDTGAVTATSIRMSATVDGTCGQMFTRRDSAGSGQAGSGQDGQSGTGSA